MKKEFDIFASSENSPKLVLMVKPKPINHLKFSSIHDVNQEAPSFYSNVQYSESKVCLCILFSRAQRDITIFMIRAFPDKISLMFVEVEIPK